MRVAESAPKNQRQRAHISSSMSGPLKRVAREIDLPDDTLRLISTGYPYISEKCRELNQDVFQTRLLLKPAICISGPAAAELFYDRERFTREGAAPSFLRKTLFGEGGVQGLDGPAHAERKKLFLKCLGPGQLPSLLQRLDQVWTEREAIWCDSAEIVCLDELALVFCETMMTWSQIPVSDIHEQTEQFRHLIEGVVPTGVHHFLARSARKATNRWLTRLVQRERRDPRAPEGSVFHQFCHFRTERGELLPEETVAVELNNVVRPTVAIAWFCLAAVRAMQEHPQLVPKENDEVLETRFVNEVRRLHPFFPMIGAVVRKAFVWRGQAFVEGRRVFFDVYGTNRDPRLWERPDVFDPSRFADREVGPYSLVAQGGGEHELGHRCAGEWVTIEFMKFVVRKMRGLRYDVPPQDLSVDLTQMPARPKSGLILRNVARPLARDGEVVTPPARS